MGQSLDAGVSGLVEFADVHKTYDGESYAVEQLTFSVRSGEFLTLLGPSGSGKTTTLLLLAGFEMPSRGDIRVNGTSITSTPPHRRNFGVVFQNYALFPHLNVIDNIAFPLSVRGMPDSEAGARAERALDLVQLAGLGARRPHQLSGGQQQRTALARALVFEPTLVLMDEPFGALDKKLREQMQLEVKQIHKTLGSTMISVTHDQAEALTMSDRIAVFDRGRLQQIGPPKEVYDRPQNLFVARFVGETNMLEGRLAGRSGPECAIELDSGERIVATAPGQLVLGARVALMLRPERVVVNAAADAHANRLPATIRDLVYGGDHLRCLLDVAGRHDWAVKVSDPVIAASLSPGAGITLSWHAADCLAFDTVG